MTFAKTLNRSIAKKLYVTSQTFEYMEFFVLTAIAFLVPLLLRHPQLLVGAVVNFMLVMAATNVRGWGKILPLIVLPSLAAAAGGLLFGPFTVYLLYMAPFIWVGNAIFVFTFKYLYVAQANSFVPTLVAAVLLKTGFLYGTALLLINLSVLPPVFAGAMGLTQLYTAAMGGVGALLATLGYRKQFHTSDS